jgi:hypothetical protein
MSVNLIIKNSTNLQIAKFLLGGVAILSMLTVAGDLQKLEVYEKNTNLKNPDTHRIFVQESDIKSNPRLNNYKLIGEIENSKPFQKISLALIGLISVSGFYIIGKILDDNSEAISYQKHLDATKAKLALDTDIAIHSQIEEAKVEVKFVNELEKELANNPTFRMLQREKNNALEKVEDSTDENDQDDGDFNPFTDTPNTQDSYFTYPQVREILALCEQGTNMKQAIKTVCDYNSTNINWLDIKNELMEKMEKIKKGDV